MDIAHPEPTKQEASSFRGWLYLVTLSFQRMARARQMLWIALGLLILSATIVGLNTAADRWTIANWKFFGRKGPTHQEWLNSTQIIVTGLPAQDPAQSITSGIWAANQAIIRQSEILLFANGVVLILFVSFLLPIWTLSFAVDAFGTERESRTLLWLTTRPIPRWSIYLAKFVAVLPWTVGFTLVGFVILCSLGSSSGALALRLFWPSILWGCLAFTSLFVLIGAFCPKPSIVALTYSFALEVIVANLPGKLKRISAGFHVRCMMYDSASDLGLQPESSFIYQPISGSSARMVLMIATILLLGLGMFLFSRKQYEGTV